MKKVLPGIPGNWRAGWGVSEATLGAGGRSVGAHICRGNGVMSSPQAASSGLLTAFLFVIYLGYSQAAQNLGLAGFQGANEVPYNRMVSEIAISNRTVFDPAKVAVWAVGGLGAGLLTLLRSRWSWWPFHPLGLAFQATTGLRVYAFGMFLTWAFKYMVLRYGGIPLYRRCQPFFLGLIVGYIVGIGISMTVDYIWFPAAGHWTHGW